MRRTPWLAVIVLGFALAAGIGCGKKQAAPQSGPVTTSTSEQSAALPTGTENPTATVPEGTPQQAPGAATATTPQAGAQGKPAVSKGPAAPAAATVQVALTRDYMEKYVVYYPKVSEAIRQAAGQKGEGGPTSFEAMRQQMEPKVTQALQGSGLTAETYWALSSRIRLAMRKLQQDEGGGGAAGRGQGAAGAGGPGGTGAAGAAGKGGEQLTAEQRQRMEQRRQEMASLTPAELALAKEYRQKIEALSPQGGGGFGGGARGGPGAGGSPRAGGGTTGT